MHSDLLLLCLLVNFPRQEKKQRETQNTANTGMLSPGVSATTTLLPYGSACICEIQVFCFLRYTALLQFIVLPNEGQSLH